MANVEVSVSTSNKVNVLNVKLVVMAQKTDLLFHAPLSTTEVNCDVASNKSICQKNKRDTIGFYAWLPWSSSNFVSESWLSFRRAIITLHHD